MLLVVVSCQPSEEVGSGAGAIHGSTALANDPASLAVGVFNAEGGTCSASIVFEDASGGIGLAAAHCVPGVGAGCQTEAQSTTNAVFAVSTTGRLFSKLTDAADVYDVDRIIPQPMAFKKRSLCTSGTYACSNTSLKPPVDQGHDLVLFHFHVRPGPNHQSPGALGISAIPVITSITDSNPSTFGVHVKLDQATDFGSGTTVRAYPVGWGPDDVVDVDAERHTGQNANGVAFELTSASTWTGPGWDQNCSGNVRFDCNQKADSAYTCNGQPGNIVEQLLVCDRPGTAPNLTGVMIDGGDSGGPLLVEAGTASWDVPDLPGPAGQRFVFGATSTTNNFLGDDNAPDGSTQANMTFAPTYSADNGPWIEATVASLLNDIDNDGVPNAQDNCPFVANPNQEDTNYVAEFQDELARGCPDYPNNACPALHQVPSSANDGTVAAFHAVFPGDACDTVASTETGKTGDTFGNGRLGPCNVVQISGNQVSSHVEQGTTCEHTLDTQLRFASWVGNIAGDAPLSSGETTPSFCRCDGASTAGDPDQSALDCGVSTPQGGLPCLVARDASIPGGTQQNAGGWRAMTEVAVGSPFPPVGTEFQDRVGVYPDLSTTRNWDMRADWGLFNVCVHPPCFTPILPTLEGVLWSHVTTFLGSTSYASSRSAQTGLGLVTNLDNHYFTMFGQESYGLRFQIIVPPAFHFHVGGWFDGVDGDPGPGDPAVLPWLAFSSNGEVVRLLGSNGSLATASFSSTALSLVAGVAAGTSDFLVGDDVATGIMHAATPNAVVIVAHNTTTVEGALRVGAGLAQGVTVSPIGTSPDPPDLRAYSAYDAKLYSLHVDPSGDTLSVVDVAAALGGVSSVTTATLVGQTPTHPLALVWNRFTRTLFAVDEIDVTAKHPWQHPKALRLLAIDPVAGQGYELWRTDGAGLSLGDFPSAAFLSVSAQGQIVLGLAGEDGGGKSEIALLDAAGLPKLSTDAPGNLVDAAQAVPAGVNLPLEPGAGDKLGMRVDLLKRSDLTAGICGAKWLKKHATGVLATAAASCKKNP